MKRISELSDDALARLARRADAELPDAPTWLVESTVALWQPRPSAPTLRGRLVALLSFDSALPTLSRAFRSTPPTARHLLFTAQGRDVDLRISPADIAGEAATTYILAGQVLGPGEGGAVSLVRGGQQVAEAVLDDFCEFRFEHLSRGTYVVAVSFDDEDIILPAIDIGGD